MTTALITGGLGLIGSNIARKLLVEHDFEQVVLLDHYGRYISSTHELFNDYRKMRLESLPRDKVVIERGESRFLTILYDVISRYKPQYIFHLAALPLAKLDNLNTEEAREGSVDSTAFILEVVGQIRAASDYDIRRFVYASSSMVYGDFESDVADEEHPTRPKEIYGTMKLAGENVALGLGRFFDIPVAIVRPSAVYGPTDMNRRVSQIFIEKAFRGEVLNIQGADEALDFTYVVDVAEGFLRAALREQGANQIFNITHGKAHTLLDYAMCLKKHFPNLEYKITERDSFRPKRGTLSIDKARRMIGYEPAYTLQQGVDEYVAFIRNAGTF